MKRTLFFWGAVILLVILAFRLYSVTLTYQEEANDREDEKTLKKMAEEIRKKENLAIEKNYFCENPYLPLVSGASWKMEVSSRTQREILDITVPAPEAERHFLVAEINRTGWNLKTYFKCQDDKDFSLDNLNLFSFLKNQNVITTPLYTSGVFLPADFTNFHGWEFEVGTKKERQNEEGRIEETFLEKMDGKLTYAGEESLKTGLGEVGTQKIESAWAVTRLYWEPVEEAAKSPEIDQENGEGREKTQELEEEKKKKLVAAINSDTCGYLEEAPLKAKNCRLEKERVEITFWISEEGGIVQAFYKEGGDYLESLKVRSLQIPAL